MPISALRSEATPTGTEQSRRLEGAAGDSVDPAGSYATVSFALPSDLITRLDEARGDLPRSEAVASVIEALLRGTAELVDPLAPAAESKDADHMKSLSEVDFSQSYFDEIETVHDRGLDPEEAQSLSGYRARSRYAWYSALRGNPILAPLTIAGMCLSILLIVSLGMNFSQRQELAELRTTETAETDRSAASARAVPAAPERGRWHPVSAGGASGRLAASDANTHRDNSLVQAATGSVSRPSASAPSPRLTHPSRIVGANWGRTQSGGRFPQQNGVQVIEVGPSAPAAAPRSRSAIASRRGTGNRAITVDHASAADDGTLDLARPAKIIARVEPPRRARDRANGGGVRANVSARAGAPIANKPPASSDTAPAQDVKITVIKLDNSGKPVKAGATPPVSPRRDVQKKRSVSAQRKATPTGQSRRAQAVAKTRRLARQAAKQRAKLRPPARSVQRNNAARVAPPPARQVSTPRRRERPANGARAVNRDLPPGSGWAPLVGYPTRIAAVPTRPPAAPGRRPARQPPVVQAPTVGLPASLPPDSRIPEVGRNDSQSTSITLRNRGQQSRTQPRGRIRIISPSGTQAGATPVGVAPRSSVRHQPLPPTSGGSSGRLVSGSALR